jgi:glyoxylase-like metal-dependent hydrolase (beta-lactamase superfamily II)
MALAKEIDVKYYINSTDVDREFDYVSLHGLSEMKIGNIQVKILGTPGHTDGSLSFLIDNKALICGDLLLLESPGRPDLARTKEDTIAGAAVLYETLHNVIFKLGDSVMIFPSHFTQTELRPVVMSLGDLKKQSKPLQMAGRDEFIDFLTSNIPKTPPNYESIKKFNKAGVIIALDYAEDLEIGPNRCAAR